MGQHFFDQRHEIDAHVLLFLGFKKTVFVWRFDADKTVRQPGASP